LTVVSDFPTFCAQSLGRKEKKTVSPVGFLEKKPGFVVFCRLVRALVVVNSPDSAHVAQLAEHVLGKDEVIGSIPIMGSRL
jgi:hypothetical protein